MDRITVNRFSFRRKGSHKNKDKHREKSPTENIPEYDISTIKYISQQESKDINEDLFTEYGFSVDQLMELAGYSCAVAIAKIYPLDKMSKDNGAILVCCGAGSNGGDGLVCARHLKMFGYKPTIFYPKHPNKPVFQNLFKQCEGLDMPVLSFFPSEPHLITDSYNFVVDALFGCNFQGPIRPEFIPVFETLKKVESPLCSIDIPSGWDVYNGDEDGLHPQLLVSIGAPKLCAKLFSGPHHFLGGRFMPRTLEQKYNLNLPPYPATDCVVELKQTDNSPEHHNNKSDH